MNRHTGSVVAGIDHRCQRYIKSALSLSEGFREQRAHAEQGNNTREDEDAAAAWVVHRHSQRLGFSGW